MSKEDLTKYGLGIDDEEEDFGDEDFGNDVDDEEEVVLEEEEVVIQEEEEEEEVVEEEADEVIADEPAPAPKEEPEAPSKTDNKMVPRDRLNKEIAKRREIEAELAALRQAKTVETSPTQPIALDKAQLKTAFENVLDGKTEEAADLLATVLGPAAAQQAQKTLGKEELSELVNQALVQRDIDACIVRVVAENEWMNDSDDSTFDAEAADEVLVWRDLYIRRGESPVNAIEKAVNRVAVEYGYKTEEAPAKAPAPASKPKPADIAKKVELAKKMPAAIPKTTEPKESERITVADMSDDDFDKLSGAALARARGDIL